MSDPTKGGRGKKAPYETTHCRIPEPIKPVVEQLATAYKRLVANGADTEKLLDGVWKSITSGYYPGDRNEHLQKQITDLDNANWELQKQLTTANDLWQKAERKIEQLEQQQKTSLPDLSQIKTYKLHGKDVIRVEDLAKLISEL